MSGGSSVRVSTSERALVTGWTLLLLLLAAIPVLHGYAGAPPGSRFSGFVGLFQNDYNSYLAWIRQAQDGHPTFRILYTTEPHGRWFFHPLFWAMGALARATGLSTLVVWHIAQAAGCAALVAAIHGLLARCVPSRPARLVALALATTASGWGWFWMRAARPSAETPFEHLPIDVWMAEASPFQAMMTSFFTLPIALALLVGGFNRILDYVESGRLRDAAACGLYGLGLASIHPYDVLTFYGVLAAWLLLHRLRRWKGFAPSTGSGLALAMGLPLPYLVYAVGVTRLAPVFSEVRWTMSMPSLPALLWGWGLPLALGAAALLDPRVRRENTRWTLPALWLAVTVLLLLAPVGFQRKLIWGATVPMCALAGMGLATWGRAALASVAGRRSRIALASGAGVAIVAVSAVGSADFYDRLLARNRQARLGDYLPAAHLEAMQWLEDHTEPAQVVIATPGIGPQLPGRIGVTVFEGHWAQTLDQARKRDFVRDLFAAHHKTTPEQARRVLDRNRVRYVVADRRSLRTYGLSEVPATTPLVPGSAPRSRTRRCRSGRSSGIGTGRTPSSGPRVRDGVTEAQIGRSRRRP